MASAWTWDPARQSYCYFSAEESSWVYQDGNRVALDGTQVALDITRVASATTSTTPEIARTSSPRYSHIDPAVIAQISQQRSLGDYSHHYQLTNAQPSQGTQAEALIQRFAQLRTNAAYDAPSQASAPQSSCTYSQSAATDPCQFISATTSSRLEYATNRSNASDATAQATTGVAGPVTQRKTCGTPGTTEPLNPPYRVQRDGRKFFIVGKVFQILWPEERGIGANSGESTPVSDAGSAGGIRLPTIRRFVVVKQGRKSCLCLPITTKGGQGCARPGTVKWQHAIIYTGLTPPAPRTSEIPTQGEYGMMESIRVRQRRRFDRLDQMARVNFGKVYTVEHNVKVLDFGEVHQGFMLTLLTQWRWVLDRNTDAIVDASKFQSSQTDEEYQKHLAKNRNRLGHSQDRFGGAHGRDHNDDDVDEDDEDEDSEE